jgi:hypothetical protein
LFPLFSGHFLIVAANTSDTIATWDGSNAGRQPREAIAPALAGYFYAALSELPRGALNVTKTRR